MFVINGEQLNKFLPVVLLLLVTACDSDRSNQVIAPLQDEGAEEKESKNKDAAEDAALEGAAPLQQKRSVPLDLTIPDQVITEQNEHQQSGAADALLPDLFSQKGSSQSQQSRTSVGGRLVLDEDNPDYSMQAVKGAEVTLEVLTP